MGIFRLVLLSLCIGTSTTSLYANAIENVHTTKVAQPLIIKQNLSEKSATSLIEQTLNKQRQAVDQLSSNSDDIKILTTIHVQPTQNFFAAQHDRFSRFIQSLFSHDS
ncbi:hypothetical protein [Acinetobacter nectaris]|uniref:hypothetical protein n=1 Tax=Acinetobacter nectaris TaxID=1219382 RepID=UPI001F2E7080|nr:hypothetical protein [Acinetobacter nectaris]MCF8999034.1 hypothetical protein [Acinetobacter nectaris]MCF9027298.1 hypothetical protein [Acinetobacter nectaris]